MNKQLLAIATALIAATTLFASNADAGFGIRIGFGGPLPSFIAHGNDFGRGSSGSSYRKREYRAARHQEKPPVRVTKKVAETTSIAKADDKPAVAPELSNAQSENSSISVASAEVVAKTTEPKTVAIASEDTSSKSLDCKKFFPSVGMTLSVPCE